MHVFVIILVGLGYLLYFASGLAIFGVFLYGIYVLFAKSVAVGLMLIGGAVVSSLVVNLVAGILVAAGGGAAALLAKAEPKN